MADVKIKGYVVRLNRRGPDEFKLEIGRKVFGHVIGRKGSLSTAGLRQSIRILELGDGGINLGGQNILVLKNGPMRILRMDYEGDIRQIALSPIEIEAITRMAQEVLDS